jgi:hypothetical protein
VNAEASEIAKRKRVWYLVHVLAVLTVVLILFATAVNVIQSATGRFPQFPTWIGVIVLICAFALFWFWVRMISDFFAVRPATHAAGWGWFLFLGAWLGALVYFWVIWRPRHRLTE